ncbi:gamma carbonic anhydrase family protein [Undibacterium sp.]|jgi:carbonic anhydrase/acetyltransferase-like protein (isoleucine patch superfamily)|uniref:gamma carbonic anhydrase family protein n=1 Tax=Undibacterium sp. TaxID=1914977 RepID=UPI002BEF62F3|nr:gamma carbonic anhydrase family protein [Undibacterium sp.]HTD07205.1 gamma carbonic anhydrase family protein [Undibacterium sp.]
MIITHDGKTPRIDPGAYVAPNALICGDVSIGPGCRILFGAQLIAESGSITIGCECIVMENAVLRSSAAHPLSIGNNCLIGPQTHVVGCTIEDQVFVATGASVFHAARLGKGSEVRINGVVHIKTHVPAGAFVPIGWVAVGAPARILPSHEHEKIWEGQEPLNFPLTVYGFDRDEADMVKITQRLSQKLASHKDDQAV